MKKLIMIMIAAAFSGAVIAQSKEEAKPMVKPEAAKEKPIKKDAGVKEEGVQNEGKPGEMKGEKAHHDKYECPQCHMHAEKPGKCSMCKVEMIEKKAEMKKEKAEMKDHKHDGHDHGKGNNHHEKKAD